jgi:hypothetical protein
MSVGTTLYIGYVSKGRTRVHLLDEQERKAKEPFVDRKMEESKERMLVDWDPKEAKERLSEVLFD